MHIRVAGLINLIGVVARLIKEKEETVVDLELLCHAVYAPLSFYLPLSLSLLGCTRCGSGLLKRREANLFRAGTFFFSFFLFLIDRMIILSFDQINEHSRAASPIHSSSWRGCCRHDTNKKKNYPRLANEPLVRSNFCGTGFFIVNRHVSRIRCNGIPAIYRFSSPVKYSR